MSRIARQESESNLYHITARGAGRRRIFEDNHDREHFIEGLRGIKKKDGIYLLAWCLMDNHVHLLAKAPLERLSSGFHRLFTSYACYFNGKHGHVGPVFQGRFDSTPIHTESHLLATIRYIHLNPLDQGIPHPRDYSWSSYQEYCNRPCICDTELVLTILSGPEAFIELCDPAKGRDYLLDWSGKRPRMSEFEAEQIAISLLGENYIEQLTQINRESRNHIIRRLRGAGLSVRQIERLTGIGRNIIARA